MIQVTCNNCGAKFTTGRPKHRWLDKEQGIALKYEQCPICKTQFPAWIQTNELLARIRKLKAMQHQANQLQGEARTEVLLETDIFHIEVVLEQEKLKEEHGKELGFLKRYCPKCGLSVTSLRAGKICTGEHEGSFQLP